VRQTALDTLHADVEIHDFDIPDAGVYRGHSGLELARRDAIVYRIEGGKSLRGEHFNDQGRALDAAGLGA
jgi:hypothetical protein